MWKTVKLGDVCTLQNGRAYKKSELLDKGKYPVLRVGNFFTSEKWYYSDLELDEAKYCDNGDLLYAWSASFGARIWEGEKVIYHYHIWRVDIDEQQIDKRFLYYWFEFDKERIKKAHGTGTTMIHVSKGSMEKRDFLLLPLTDQQRIVAKLDAAFTEIDKAMTAAERKRQQADKLKQSILAGELSADDASWKTVKLSDAARVIAGQSPQSVNYNKNGDGLPFYQGKKDYGERYLNPPTVWTTKVTKRAKKDDILISVRAPVGALNIATEEICIGRGLAAIRAKEVIDRDFLYFQLLSAADRLDGSAGVIFNSTNKKQLENITLFLPPLTEQRRIAAKLDTAFAETATLTEATSKQIANYRALKSAILARELQSEAA